MTNTTTRPSPFCTATYTIGNDPKVRTKTFATEEAWQTWLDESDGAEIIDTW